MCPAPVIREVRAPTPDQMDTARRLVVAHLATTPVDAGNGTVDHPALKLENTQPTGSFKVRGALAALAAAPAGIPVISASAGNHALGLALAASKLGRAVTVVVPESASPAKVNRLRRMGVELLLRGSCYDDAESYARELAGGGGYFVSPYNDPHVIAGQSTIGCELDTQMDGPLTVVCAVGGGGLASGLGLWAANRPDVRIVGVEAAASTAVSSAIASGRQVAIDVRPTLADGLAGNLEPGSITVGLIACHVDQLVTVTEAEIRTALRYLAADRGYVTEGSGAVPVAALLAGKITAKGRVVAILSGRNIAMPALASVFTGP